MKGRHVALGSSYCIYLAAFIPISMLIPLQSWSTYFAMSILQHLPWHNICEKTTTISISSLEGHTRKSWNNELHCFFAHNFEDFKVCSVERQWLWMVWLTDVASSSRKTGNLRKGWESWFGNAMLFAFCYIHIWIAGVYIYIIIYTSIPGRYTIYNMRCEYTDVYIYIHTTYRLAKAQAPARWIFGELETIPKTTHGC